MMNFRTVTKALNDLLGDAANGRFNVVGYEGQGKHATEIKDTGRTIQCFFNEGHFAKSSGRMRGTVQHALTYTISFSVSAASRLNLNALNDPNAQPAQIAAALGAMQNAAYRADELLDELYEFVYQIIMDPRNYDLGLPVGTVTDRWVEALKKNEPAQKGSLVVLSGEAVVTCGTTEQVPGDTGVLMTEGVNVSVQASFPEGP